MGDSVESREFRALPSYNWEDRPQSLPLDLEEVRTALALGHGDIGRAAEFLRVTVVRLNRFIRGSLEVQGLIRELTDAVIARAAGEPVRALFDPNADDRRREWASTKILQSRVAQGHPFSPAPPQSAQSSASVTLTDGTKRITFRWRTDADEALASDASATDEASVIEHDSESGPPEDGGSAG